MYKNIFIKQQKSFEFLLNILNGLHGITYIINIEGKYLGHSTFNEHQLKKYKVPNYFVNKYICDLFPKKIADNYLNFALEAVLQDKQIELQETYSSTGIKYNELFYNKPLKNKNNKIIGIIGQIIDINFLKDQKDLVIYDLKSCQQFKNSTLILLQKISLLINRMQQSPSIYNNDNKCLIAEVKHILKYLIDDLKKEEVDYFNSY